MQEVVNKAVKYREAHGYYPSSHLIQAELALLDEHEQQRERGDQGESSIDYMRCILFIVARFR